MTTAKGPEISLKLLIDKSSGKVVFAEAKKDFVDFLFGLMGIPMGTIMALLIRRGVAGSAGSLGRIYESIKNLDDEYLQQPSQGKKDSLLTPKMAVPNIKPTPLLAQFGYPKQPVSDYHPGLLGGNRPVPVTSLTTEGYVKPTPLLAQSGYPKQPVSDYHPGLLGGNRPVPVTSLTTEGYVKEGMIYMVKDDLTVKPMSTISTITLLNTLGVTNLSCLQEMTVEVDFDKVGLFFFIFFLPTDFAFC
ncbi:hypothetical protein U1Q18_033302 [Sarracenia purpurea var. burkii]